MLLSPRYMFVVSLFGLPYARNSSRHYLIFLRKSPFADWIGLQPAAGFFVFSGWSEMDYIVLLGIVLLLESENFFSSLYCKELFYSLFHEIQGLRPSCHSPHDPAYSPWKRFGRDEGLGIQRPDAGKRQIYPVIRHSPGIRSPDQGWVGCPGIGNGGCPTTT